MARAYICIARNDVDENLLQVLDLKPNSSQRVPSLTPEGQTGYITHSPQHDTVVAATAVAYYGLAAYLWDTIEDVTNGNKHLTVADCNTVAAAILAAQGLGTALTSVVINPIIVAATGGARPYTRDVQVGRCEADEPHVDVEAARRSVAQQPRHSLAAERGLEREVEPPGDGSLEEVAAQAPGQGVGVLDRRLADLGRHFVRVEVDAATRSDHGAADAALAGAAGTREHPDGGTRCSVSRHRAPLSPPPRRVRRVMRRTPRACARGRPVAAGGAHRRRRAARAHRP